MMRRGSEGVSRAARLVDDDDGLLELSVERALKDLAQKVLVDLGLQAVDDLRVVVGEVGAALDVEAVVEGLVLLVIALEQALVVLEHMHLETVQL